MADENSLGGLQTIGAEELGKLVGRATRTVRIDSRLRPDSLPPRLVIPGSKRLLWRVVDVRDWMEALALKEAERRERERAYANRLSIRGRLASRSGLPASRRRRK